MASAGPYASLNLAPPLSFFYRRGAGVVICLERGADLYMAQLMPLPLTVSCFRKIQSGFTYLVPAHPGSPGKRAVKRLCVCMQRGFCVCMFGVRLCMSVGHNLGPPITDKLFEVPFGIRTRAGLRHHVLDGNPDTQVNGKFCVHLPAHCKV